MKTPHRALGPWKLKDLKKIKKNGLKVFSCFHCGGGSTMGYKLSGFEVLGGVEIDPRMMEIYQANHSPRMSHLMGVQDFAKDGNIPPGLEDLDILDGSPPCSSFSFSGKRDKKWGKKGHFREGQAEQVLDNLFFDFIRVAGVLRPKVVIAENVRDMLAGKAKGYVKEIFEGFKRIGYRAQLFLLTASRMGVPQARRRVFFVAVRDDLQGKVEFTFDEPIIPLGDVIDHSVPVHFGLNRCHIELFTYFKEGDTTLKAAYERKSGKNGYFNCMFQPLNKPANTVVASSGASPIIMPYRRKFTDQEHITLQTFPTDFNFLKEQVKYVCGMSVPPFMMQRVALEVGRQIFGVDYDTSAPRPLAS